MDIAILAHERFPDRAKTATGILRYGNQTIRAVLDRSSAGSRTTDHRSDLSDAPIVAGIEDIPAIDTSELDALVIGIAPIGGGFEESWRADVRGALERGCDVISGLHYFLTEDEEFAALAAEHGGDLIDVRKPPDDLTVSEGRAGGVEASVALTVGTDCSVGKMTVSYELVAAARAAGLDAAVIPTGQTAIMIEGWGIPVDRTIGDFAAGAVESMVLEHGDDYDLLVVEGQGSLFHPAYSPVTAATIHGSMADSLVLCHAAGRERVHGYESFSLPSIEGAVSLYESFAAPVTQSRVVAGALNTSALDSGAASDALAEYGRALGEGVPAIDPVRFGAEAILGAIR
jgi:uncharacterized NAD-dependent epimerase/dehydratase family protein